MKNKRVKIFYNNYVQRKNHEAVEYLVLGNSRYSDNSNTGEWDPYDPIRGDIAIGKSRWGQICR